MTLSPSPSSFNVMAGQGQLHQHPETMLERASDSAIRASERLSIGLSFFIN
jgi:hypothetical protein